MKRLFFILFITHYSLLIAECQWTDAYIPDFRVNDDLGTQLQVDSKIAVDSTGDFVVVWSDARNLIGNSWYQTYCQIFNRDGSRVGVNFRIGHDTTYDPIVTVLMDGRFIVSWQRIFQNPFQTYEYYFQRFDRSGQQLSQPIRVTDTSYVVSLQDYYGTDIASDSSGKFMYVWSNIPVYGVHSKIYFQRFDSVGNRIGAVQLVNEDTLQAEYPSAAVNKNGSFVITWMDHRSDTTYDIYMQRYNNSGVKIGNNIKVNEDFLHPHNFPSVSSDGRGNFVISWTDYRLPGYSPYIYYQMYDSTGAAIGLNRQANTLQNFQGVGFSVTAMRSDGFFFIGWTDWNYTANTKFYGRRFDSVGTPYGNPNTPYMIPINPPVSSAQGSDDLFILGDRVYACWSDNRNGNADIYCNVRGFQNPDTVLSVSGSNDIIGNFKLFPAYPNPFNQISKIKYQISKLTHVRLEIYDITGRLLETLINEQLQLGIYEMSWNADRFASGLYFVEMRTEEGFKEIQKIILLK